LDEHVPVLIDEVLDALAIDPAGIYVDATFGRGGHSRAILSRLGVHGRLLAMDRDPEAVNAGRKLEQEDARFVIEQESFGHLTSFLKRHEAAAAGVHGILMDLGVSSPQLDDPSRGFSFQVEGPLDMRMDPRTTPSAAEWLNSAPESEIAMVLRRFGEERAAGRLARAICARRSQRAFATTTELADVIVANARAQRAGKHPATRVFQAIRIFINREIDELAAALGQALAALRPAGRLCVVSFHSLEDRLVKRFMRDNARVSPDLARLPGVPAGAHPRLRLQGRATHATAAEVARNPRARSAVLRVAERLI
jgi:16S rRNA (cytosine1402-N4)-methyltransferase